MLRRAHSHDRLVNLILIGVISTIAGPAWGRAASAQGSAAGQPYEPAVPAPTVNSYGGVGYGNYRRAGTAAGSAMDGMASAISARGDYNLSTSAAAVNMTQAQSQEIQNRQQYTNAYFQMRAENKKAREAEEGPMPTEAELVRLAHEDVPKPLRPSEMNAVNGHIVWPGVLQESEFATLRTWIAEGFAKKAKYGQLSYSDQKTLRRLINSMASKLGSQIRSMPPQDFVTGKSFLRRLMYAGCKCQLG